MTWNAIEHFSLSVSVCGGVSVLNSTRDKNFRRDGVHISVSSLFSSGTHDPYESLSLSKSLLVAKPLSG